MQDGDQRRRPQQGNNARGEQFAGQTAIRTATRSEDFFAYGSRNVGFIPNPVGERDDFSGQSGIMNVGDV